MFTGNYFIALNSGAVHLENESIQLKMLFMTDEERTKQEIILKNKRVMLEKMRKEAEYKRELADLSMKERHAKGLEKAKDSKGNTLKFGATLKKFEQPPESKGGWWDARIG